MPQPPDAQLEILADPEALAQRVATWMLDLALAKEGNFTVALSGGTTPKRLYELLAAEPIRARFPWSRTHWFWGDERFVPHDDQQSNYRMVFEAMLSHVPVPEANIHPVPTEPLPPEAAATVYEQELKRFYGRHDFDASRPLFDLVLLGLGEDGHTASLLPHTDVLKIRDRWVAPVTDAKKGTRITLTYPALESSERVAFLIAGREKKSAFAQLRQGTADLPAGHLRPVGKLIWFADKAAASAAP